MKVLLISLVAAVVFPTVSMAVETVENGLEARRPLQITFTEDLRITAEDRDDHYIWAGNNVGVQVDQRGHMFVLDPKENRIVELDPQGQFVRQHGGQGEGPTEYRALNVFQILGDGSAIGFESLGFNSFLTRYDAKMNHLGKKRLDTKGRSFRSVFYADDGKLLAGTVTQVDQGRGVEITEYLIANADFEVQKVLLYWESPSLNPEKVSDPQHWVDFLAHRFDVLSKGKNAYAVFEDSGEIISASSDTYEVTVWDRNFRPRLKFTKTYKPIAQSEREVDALVEPIRDALFSMLPESLMQVVTENVIRRAVKKAEFPAVKFPINGLRRMGDYLLVVHAVNYETLAGRADIFDKKGRYRGSFTMAGNGLQRVVFQNGFAYTVETVDDESELVRYRYQIAEKS